MAREDSEEELLQVDDLFVGLTRPASVMGIPYTAFVIEAIGVALVFLAIGNPLWLLLFAPTHAMLYLVAGADPGRFDNWAMFVKVQGRCLNRTHWKATSFSPLPRTRTPGSKKIH